MIVVLNGISQTFSPLPVICRRWAMFSVVSGILFHVWIGKAIIAIAAIALADTLFTAVLLFRHRNRGLPSFIAPMIDSVLMIAAVLPLMVCTWGFLGFAKALSIIPTAGVGDTKVLAVGLGELFIPLNIAFALFFVFLVIWLLLRAIYRQIREHTAITAAV
jgi:hypothetical protein